MPLATEPSLTVVGSGTCEPGSASFVVTVVDPPADLLFVALNFTVNGQVGSMPYIDAGMGWTDTFTWPAEPGSTVDFVVTTIFWDYSSGTVTEDNPGVSEQVTVPDDCLPEPTTPTTEPGPPPTEPSLTVVGSGTCEPGSTSFVVTVVDPPADLNFVALNFTVNGQVGSMPYIDAGMDWTDTFTWPAEPGSTVDFVVTTIFWDYSSGTVTENDPGVSEQVTVPDDCLPEPTAPTSAPATSAPDTSAPDTSAPDTSAPDTSAPDTSAPDTSAPDTSAPDTSAPDTSAPDTSAPDTSAPDTSAPDTSAPDTSAPDTSAPDTSAPDTTAPDTTEALATTTSSTTSSSTTTTSVSPTTTSAPATTDPDGPTPPPAALVGNAVCSVEAGETTLTWLVRNNTGSATNISGDTRGLTFDPNPVPANGTSTATEVIAGPAEDQEITETVTVDVGFSLGNGGTSDLSATVTVGACTGPAAPPDIAFTFTNDPSVDVAEVGDTIDYTYCGENTSDVELEVVRVVDDRFGVLEVPQEQTIVEPGEALCSTDLGLPVSYVATAADAGTTIVNNATVTVRTVGEAPQAFQASDPAEVEILGFQSPEQVEPTTTTLPVTALADTGASGLPAQLIAAALAISTGWMLVLVGRRRSAT